MRPRLASWLILGALMLSACDPAATPQDDQETPVVNTTLPARGTSVPPEMQLSNELMHGCQAGGRRNPGPAEGEPAIDFTLRDVDGNEYTLSELLQEKPVVLIFGSFT